MTGLGTIVNIGAILAGCLVGMLLKGGLPKRLQDTISSAVGLCVVFVGITGGIKGLMTMSGSGFETRDTLVTVVCMVAGAALGEWINIEYKLEQLGDWCKSRIPGGQKSGTFTEAFVSSSLLFCVGAMAIVGSLEDGLSHNYSTQFTKAVMDGVLHCIYRDPGHWNCFLHLSGGDIPGRHDCAGRTGEAVSHGPDDYQDVLYWLHPYFRAGTEPGPGKQD